MLGLLYHRYIFFARKNSFFISRLSGVSNYEKKPEKFFKLFFKNPLTNPKLSAIILPVEINGASPSGKATDSDSVIS